MVVCNRKLIQGGGVLGDTVLFTTAEVGLGLTI